MNQVESVLGELIASASTLLDRAVSIPDGETNTGIAGYVHYDERITRPLAKDVESWQAEAVELLRVLYGEEARQVVNFENSVRDKTKYFKFREGIQAELEACISKLRAYVKAEEVKKQVVEISKDDSLCARKTPMVFISHSSGDKDFAESLVTLLEDLGLNKSNLFCSSVDGYGVGLCQDIFATLFSLFSEHNLFVIFILSPRYYKSVVSLNEMGAAWVLKTDFCSFLTRDMEFDKIKGVVNKNAISIKVDAPDAPSRLTEFKDILIRLFGLSPIEEIKWERKRNAFLGKVQSLDYQNIKEDEASNETSEFNENELQIFSKWANNKVNSVYTAFRTLQGLNVFLGSNNSYVFPFGEPMAEFEDYMNRLVRTGYVELDRYDGRNKVPIYKITKRGYDFAKSIKVEGDET